MKAMRLADSGATAVLVEENVPQPQPGRGAYTGEVRRAAASTVSAARTLDVPSIHVRHEEKEMKKFSKDPDAISRLSPEQYRVTQQRGTERPGTGEYLDNKEPDTIST